ncbi:putative amidohydrolase [Klebsiella grimontii]|uniref:Putative amidohydrolase n=1 Tax=Klebsiella grimontii TaxID=2058152 RepID=A0A7H4P071_9ENTR|nr:putative amidohydrolase [Klebsiella grimontii]
MSSSAETRRRAVQAARGESPFDLLLTDAQIVDMATGEIREGRCRDRPAIGSPACTRAAAAPMPANAARWRGVSCLRG